MSNRKQPHDELSDGVAAAIVIAGLASLFFLLRIMVTMLVRAYTKYRMHPLMVGAAASWVTALVVATTVAFTTAVPAVGVATGLIATAVFIGSVALMEIILDQRQPTPGDESLEQQLGGWWRQP